ncbi:MAG: hypothetical protein NPINA01_06380 [Nitrospinaceae bacterium]|nr:MAG: hypothetical protein NPINA01_06380 [Nitrospinaceae bacterium]
MKMTLKRKMRTLAVHLFLILFFSTPALGFELDLRGSLGKSENERYVPPLANPIRNETAYITTEARPIFIHNVIPSKFVTGGGNINLFAVELRVALTERLGFIASKDGYADLNFDSVLPDTHGFINISAGLKYALISNHQEQKYLTVGFEYEPPTGNISTGGIDFQGNGPQGDGGDGLIDLFVTGAKAYGKLGLQGSTGVDLALDRNHDSSFWHWSGGVNYELFKNFFPLIEVNGLTTIDDGNRTGIASFEGNDIVNFGSTDSGTVVTLGVGARYKFNRHIQMGAGYEKSVSGQKDLFDWRTNVDFVISY